MKAKLLRSLKDERLHVGLGINRDQFPTLCAQLVCLLFARIPFDFVLPDDSRLLSGNGEQKSDGESESD